MDKIDLKTLLLSQFETEFVPKGKYIRNLKGHALFSSMKNQIEKGILVKRERSQDSAGSELELLKNLLIAGNLEECPKLIEKLRDISVDDVRLHTEVLLQEARFEFLQGEWMKSIQICNLIEGKAHLLPLTSMVIHQLRSNAYFELSQFEKSLIEHQKIQAMTDLLPNGEVPLYAQVNRIRIEARLNGLESAKKEEQLLWSKWSNQLQGKSISSLLLLIRARIDLLRLEGSDFRREAIAAQAIAETMGDDLSYGLAFFDFYLGSIASGNAEILSLELMEQCRAHLQIEKLYEGVFASNASIRSETMKSMRHYLEMGISHSNSISNEDMVKQMNVQIETIILMGQGVRVQMIDGEMTKMNRNSSHEEIICVPASTLILSI